MPKKSRVAPIPQSWLSIVLPILEDGDLAKILWSGRATQDWEDLAPQSFKDDGHQLLTRVLSQPGVLGEPIYGMTDKADQTSCDTWAFLCPHPAGVPTQVYAKIGVHHGQLRINLFSLHVDLTKKLELSIAAYLVNLK